MANELSARRLVELIYFISGKVVPDDITRSPYSEYLGRANYILGDDGHLVLLMLQMM